MIITAEVCRNVHQHLCSRSPGHTNRLHFPAPLRLGAAQMMAFWPMREGCTRLRVHHSANVSRFLSSFASNWKADPVEDSEALTIMVKPYDGRGLDS